MKSFFFVCVFLLIKGLHQLYVLIITSVLFHICICVRAAEVFHQPCFFFFFRCYVSLNNITISASTSFSVQTHPEPDTATWHRLCVCVFLKTLPTRSHKDTKSIISARVSHFPSSSVAITLTDPVNALSLHPDHRVSECQLLLCFVVSVCVCVFYKPPSGSDEMPGTL